MKYYFIYSAGGGAGDWNGIKRIWKESMPEALQSHILLKFGDIFFNHATDKNLIRADRWQNLNNIRKWLSENVNDDYVLRNSEILLDSGTSKIVNQIAHHNPKISPIEILKEFDNFVDKLNSLEKYADIIIDSEINYAVTYDVPNPFKTRSQNGNARTNLMNAGLTDDFEQLNIQYCAKYANKLYEILKDKIGQDEAINRIMITCNGIWTQQQYNDYLSKLIFEPKNIAIGGLTRKMKNYYNNLISWDLAHYSKIHYLGCAGMKNVAILKEHNLDFAQASVDVSTPINRSIDGNTQNTAWSGYFSYIDKNLYRIKDDTKEAILQMHSNSPDTLFSVEAMEEILDEILKHQHGKPSKETYNARAKLILHNSDVFRINAM